MTAFMRTRPNEGGLSGEEKDTLTDRLLRHVSSLEARLSTDSLGRARMRMWTKQLDEGLHAAVGSLSFAIAFRHQWLTRSVEDCSKWLAGIPLSDRRERLASLVERGLESPYFAPAVTRYAKLFEDFEMALEHGSWLEALLANGGWVCSLLGTAASSWVRPPLRTPSPRRGLGEKSRTAAVD
jgi:hypothetical protein